MEQSQTLLSIGEYELHKRIQRLLGVTSTSAYVPGDDACIVSITKENAIAICTDIVPSGIRGADAGRFAVVHNFSDLLAMGAKPVGILISFCAPPDFPLKDYDELIIAAQNEAAKYSSNLLGGDTKQSTFHSVVGSAIGMLNPKSVIQRFGAKPGDIIAVTKTNGRGWGRRWAYRVYGEMLNEANDLLSRLKKADLEDFTLPYKEMLVLAEKGIVTSGIDCSDGLSASINLLATASNVGAIIEMKELENLIARDTLAVANELKITPSLFCFTPGYDWECLVTIKEENFNYACDLVNSVGGGLKKIGKITSEKQTLLIDNSIIKVLPDIGDMKFHNGNQYNTPLDWIKYMKIY